MSNIRYISMITCSFSVRSLSSIYRTNNFRLNIIADIDRDEIESSHAKQINWLLFFPGVPSRFYLIRSSSLFTDITCFLDGQKGTVPHPVARGDGDRKKKGMPKR